MYWFAKRAPPQMQAVSTNPTTSLVTSDTTPASKSDSADDTSSNTPTNPSKNDISAANKSPASDAPDPPATSQVPKTQATPVAQKQTQKADHVVDPPASATSSSNVAVQTKAPAPAAVSNPVTSSSLVPTPTSTFIPLATPVAVAGTRNRGTNNVNSVKHGSVMTQSFSTPLPDPNSNSNIGSSDDHTNAQDGSTTPRANDTAQIAAIVTFALLAFFALLFVIPFIRHKLKARAERKMYGDGDSPEFINEFQVDLKQSASSSDINHSYQHGISDQSAAKGMVDSQFDSQSHLYHNEVLRGDISHQSVSSDVNMTQWYPENHSEESKSEDTINLHVSVRLHPICLTDNFLLTPGHHRTSILPTMLFQHRTHQAHAALQERVHDDDTPTNLIIYNPPAQTNPIDFVVTQPARAHPGHGVSVDPIFGLMPSNVRASSVYSHQTMGAMLADDGRGGHAMSHDIPPLPPLTDAKMN
ncbi:uncharacterized protein MELLADRAFT_61174 [Melampsora larici-populina 98AG31]|uniref:Uncharacterized protein n=1 Tax=Melampsora larici-populina (strain 98AG31 / pathotype 3-4-7) TaxID=747676 RepID=F4RDW0_MELLP|nr:uncharacterized protein MELLADRAFT_61174 [Melampsora larici-populina 98AG31]EGG09473.1 hypothetical protein MELLADRAFT_61174 [Melampsora larici-populina 98AG31]